MTERPHPRERLAVDVAVRLAVLAFILWLGLSVLHPFLPVMIWAVVLSVALNPLFHWLRSRFGGRGIPAAVFVSALALVVVFGPMAMLTSNLVVSLEELSRDLRNGTIELPDISALLLRVPLWGARLHEGWALQISNAPDMLGRYGHTLLRPGEWLLRVIAGLGRSVVEFAIAVVVAGFLYMPGPHLLGWLRRAAVRIAGQRGARFVTLTGATIRSVARGIIGVAVLQALVIGIVLLICEVPHAGLLTLAALVLAILQIGTGVIVLPLIVWLWLTRDVGTTVFFTLAMGPVFVIEHILKPIVMGKGLDTPLLVILLGVLGGAVSYGLPGLFLGPIILAVCYDLLVFWVSEEDAEPPPVDQ